ncbi:MAG: protein kinase [Candidatus Obscuribacterales bacterium]|nr:protein kinase [Candidatus Obscuribacterales bacterium]
MPENPLDNEEPDNGDSVFQGQQLAKRQQVRLSVDDSEKTSTPESQSEESPCQNTSNIEQNSTVRQVLPKPFEIVGELGRGGMSIVYRAIDNRREAPFNEVAVKVLHESLASDPTVAKRFAQEAEVVNRLDHPNIVKIEGVGTTNSGIPFIELEFVDGISLSELLSQQQNLSPYHVCQIASQICDALEHALSHGVIHRDLKPSNILVSKTGDEYVVKVLDFGIAKTLERDIGATAGLTRTGDIFGSPAYMSPEQCTGGRLDTRSDIYSLGCVMYEMLTGYNPFAADNPIKSILKHVEDKAEPFEIEFAKLKIPKRLEKIVLSCLDKSPEKRFDNPTELKKKLSALLGKNPLPWWELQLRGLHSNFTDFIILIAIFSFTYNAIPEPVQMWYFGGLLIFYYSLSTFWKSLRGTPGKALSKLQVSTPEGKSMSFAQSLYRLVCLTPILFLVGIAFHFIENLQNLDMSNGNQRFFERIFLLLLLIAGSTIIDRLSGRHITRRPAVSTPIKRSRLMEFHFDKNRKLAGILALFVTLLCIGLGKLDYDLEARVNSDPTIKWKDVVYSTRDVPEGEKVLKDGTEVKRILQRKAPDGALQRDEDAVGKIAKFGISKGQIITQYDFAQKAEH